MENRVVNVLIFIFVLLTIFTTAFTLKKYAYGEGVFEQTKLYQTQIANLEKNLDQTAKEKEAKKQDNNKAVPKVASCPPALTSADQDETSLWRTYENVPYEFSFKYPQTWMVGTDTTNQLVLTDSEADINFQFRSAALTGIGFEGMDIQSSQNLVVACQTAHKVSYTGPAANDRLIVTTFSKSGTTHLVMISYQYVGASISSDTLEAY